MTEKIDTWKYFIDDKVTLDNGITGKIVSMFVGHDRRPKYEIMTPQQKIVKIVESQIKGEIT